MSTKSKKLKIRLNLQIDEETKEMSSVLREKNHINISSLCRDAIRKTYYQLKDN